MRAIHASSGIGHSITASGIPTNTSAVVALTAILHNSSARNSSAATIAIRIARMLNATAAANATASTRAVSSSTLPLPSSPRPASLARSALWPNSHGHSTMNSAAPTVRARPSSASSPPEPVSPAAQ